MLLPMQPIDRTMLFHLHQTLPTLPHANATNNRDFNSFGGASLILPRVHRDTLPKKAGTFFTLISFAAYIALN